MILYYITDRKQFPGTEAERRRAVLDKIGEAAAAGVDYVQLRERDLCGRELEAVAREAVEVVRAAGTKTRLLINSRVDIALACGADGVHLRSDDIAGSEARGIARERTGFVVGVSCHDVDEVKSAWSHGADFAVFAPVFEKGGREGSGLVELKKACAAVPGFVVALGGVTEHKVTSCAEAGAAGIAGIRLFQNGILATLVPRLKAGGSR